MILPLVLEDIISEYIIELTHINNFNKYKYELKRSFYNCDSRCDNCDDKICNKNNLIISPCVSLCDGCDKLLCEECEEKLYECNVCGDCGMFNEDITYYIGPTINICYGCDEDLCDDCFEHIDCNKCGSIYCPDCLNHDFICTDCVNE